MAGLRPSDAETEAAAWHGRLGAPSVTTETIQEFFAWRASPENAEAYARVERIWGASAHLAADPVIGEAVDRAMTRNAKPVRTPRLPRTTVGLGLVSVLAVAVFAGWVWRQHAVTFTTAVGEQRLVQLADGSSVRLDTDSRIRVRFDGALRRVELEEGQALFTVAHDRHRAFIVQAGSAEVTAVGTVFEVRRLPEGADVTLVSGVVDVDGGAGKSRMTAGRQAIVSRAGSVSRAIDLETATSWTDGRIVFRDTPLRAAVEEVNRYLTDKVELGDVGSGDARIDGVFRTGDREAFVSAAALQFGLQAVKAADGSVRLEPAKK